MCATALLTMHRAYAYNASHRYFLSPLITQDVILNYFSHHIRSSSINFGDEAPNCFNFFRNLTKKPHLAGSDRNNELADWIENKWKSYGFKTRQDEYNVLLSYPGNATNRNQVGVCLFYTPQILGLNSA